MMPSVFLAALGIVIGLPVTLGIVSDLYKRRLAFKEREMELLSRQTAEKTACACWNGSSPIPARISRCGSRRCAKPKSTEVFNRRYKEIRP